MKKAQNGVFRCFGCEPTEKVVYHYAKRWSAASIVWKTKPTGWNVTRSSNRI
ncbi:hypothetical protein YC2023_018324 [Brassica napus]